MEQHNAAQTARFHAHITHRKSEGHRGCHIEKVEKNGGIAACKNQFLGLFLAIKFASLGRVETPQKSEQHNQINRNGGNHPGHNQIPSKMDGKKEDGN